MHPQSGMLLLLSQKARHQSGAFLLIDILRPLRFPVLLRHPGGGIQHGAIFQRGSHDAERVIIQRGQTFLDCVRPRRSGILCENPFPQLRERRYRRLLPLSGGGFLLPGQPPCFPNQIRPVRQSRPVSRDLLLIPADHGTRQPHRAFEGLRVHLSVGTPQHLHHTVIGNLRLEITVGRVGFQLSRNKQHPALSQIVAAHIGYAGKRRGSPDPIALQDRQGEHLPLLDIERIVFPAVFAIVFFSQKFLQRFAAGHHMRRLFPARQAGVAHAAQQRTGGPQNLAVIGILQHIPHTGAQLRKVHSRAPAEEIRVKILLKPDPQLASLVPVLHQLLQNRIKHLFGRFRRLQIIGMVRHRLAERAVLHGIYADRHRFRDVPAFRFQRAFVQSGHLPERVPVPDGLPGVGVRTVEVDVAIQLGRVFLFQQFSHQHMAFSQRLKGFQKLLLRQVFSPVMQIQIEQEFRLHAIGKLHMIRRSPARPHLFKHALHRLEALPLPLRGVKRDGKIRLLRAVSQAASR